ncbi:MAG: hypothetical protein ACREIA_06015 [Opitutaceae bacterium]
MPSPARAGDLDAPRQLIAEAMRGSSTTAGEAAAQLHALLAREPKNAEARAMLGLAIVLQARDAPMLRKRALAAAGFAEMDAAVAQAPDSIEARLIRATNASQMPLVLGRNEIATDDFRRLLGRIEEDARDVSPSLRRRILFHAGAFALRERRFEAVSLLERALRIEATEPRTEEIQSMLALARRQLTPRRHADVEDENQAQAAAP